MARQLWVIGAHGGEAVPLHQATGMGVHRRNSTGDYVLLVTIGERDYELKVGIRDDCEVVMRELASRLNSL